MAKSIHFLVGFAHFTKIYTATRRFLKKIKNVKESASLNIDK